MRLAITADSINRTERLDGDWTRLDPVSHRIRFHAPSHLLILESGYPMACTAALLRTRRVRQRGRWAATVRVHRLGRPKKWAGRAGCGQVSELMISLLANRDKLALCFGNSKPSDTECRSPSVSSPSLLGSSLMSQCDAS